MKKENLFFDLDGTIIDSSQGIFNSIKYVVDSYNLKMPDNKTLSSFIGPPLHDSFKRVFNVDFKTSDMYVSKYREYYSEKGLFEFSLYDGLLDVFKLLEKKYTLFITTSKPTHYAKLILDKADALKYFKDVSGSFMGKPDSSKEEVVNNVICKYSLDKNLCALIGDTRFDGEGAKISGVDFFGVSYGFGREEELKEYKPVKIFKTTKEISDYFLGWKYGY